MRSGKFHLRLFLEKVIDNRKAVLFIWASFILYGTFKAITASPMTNYVIFKYVYIHALHASNLYTQYPNETTDVNLYGPLFSLVIAPFTYLPDKVGAFLWSVANALFLLFAILKLPLPGKWKNFLILLSSQEMMITSNALQSNAIVCGCVLLGYAYVKKGKDFWALFFIMASTFIKIYGIAGLAFFFLSRKKKMFLTGILVWSIIFFLAPIVIMNLSFLVQSYRDWYEGLKAKAAKNSLLDEGVWYQNISVPGMIRRILYSAVNDIFILIPGAILFFSQYLRYKYLQDIRYQLYLLSSVLISIVIFSTGTETSTFIIALPGMCLWYLLQPKSKLVSIFFIIAFVITSFSYSDILTPWARRHLFKPYSLKAFFPFVIWVIILIQIYIKQFLKATNPFTLMKLSSV